MALGSHKSALFGGSPRRRWSSIYKSSGINLSADGLTASSNTATNGLAIIGNESTRIKAGRKTYFEIVLSGSNLVFGGGIQNATASTTLGSNYIRFYTLNPNPDPGTDEAWFLGSHVNPTLYTESSVPAAVGDEQGVTGWAVDTITSRVWITRDGTNWFGGGNPALGLTPSFSIDVTGWVPRAEIYYASGGPLGANATLRFSRSSFSYTPPAGF